MPYLYLYLWLLHMVPERLHVWYRVTPAYIMYVIFSIGIFHFHLFEVRNVQGCMIVSRSMKKKFATYLRWKPCFSTHYCVHMTLPVLAKTRRCNYTIYFYMFVLHNKNIQLIYWMLGSLVNLKVRCQYMHLWQPSLWKTGGDLGIAHNILG